MANVIPHSEPVSSAPAARVWGVAVLLLASSLGAFLLLRPLGLIGDEGIHALQVRNFAFSRWELTDGLTTIPGYHLVLAVLALLTGVTTAHGLRLVSLAMSLPATAVFFMLARRVAPTGAGWATAQLHFLPILFPFLPLLYTDGFSLFLVLLCLYCAAAGWRNGAAAVGILSMLVRQNNVVWLLFAALLSYQRDFGSQLSWVELRQFARRHALLLAGLGLFAAFVVINRGVAVGDRGAHPMRLSLGNLYLLLFLSFVVSLPGQLALAAPALRWCVTDKRVLAAALLLFALGYATFSNDHPYNQVGPTLEAHIFTEQAVLTNHVPYLRNILLNLVDQNPLVRLCFFAVVTCSALVLARTRWVVRGFVWLPLFAALYLVPSWLIEQRYCFVPLALILLGRERQSTSLELANTVFSVVIAGALVWGIAHEAFFL
jgi:alpha-1,2-glucosyltransferase